MLRYAILAAAAGKQYGPKRLIPKAGWVNIPEFRSFFPSPRLCPSCYNRDGNREK